MWSYSKRWEVVMELLIIWVGAYILIGLGVLLVYWLIEFTLGGW